MSDYGDIEDGFGSIWPRCGPNCTLEVVRPGKVQCINLIEALSGVTEGGDENCPDRPAPSPGPLNKESDER